MLYLNFSIIFVLIKFFLIFKSKNQKKIFKLGNFQKYGKQPTVQKREKRVVKPGTQKTVKQLLGELYADKVYLEKLLSDDRKITSSKNDKAVNHSNCLFLLTIFFCSWNLMKKSFFFNL